MSTPPTPDSDIANTASRPSQRQQPPHGLVRILFPLGNLVATPAALRLLERLRIEPMTLIRRHVQGDWGELCPEDVQANNEALIHGFRLLSSYTLTSQAQAAVVTADNVTGNADAQSAVIWIITEADRTTSTVLTPSDY